MTRLYRSLDDGSLFQEKELDQPIDPDQFHALDVNDVITLSPAQCCVGCNDLLEVLIRAGQARLVASWKTGA